MSVDVEAVAAPPTRGSAGRALAVRTAIGLAIGGALVLVFLQLVSVPTVARRVEHLDVGLAVLSGVAFLSAYIVRALRWRWFLAPDQVPARRVIGIYYVGIFLNWALPVQGGEIAKSAILRRTDGIPMNRSLAAVTMDKTMDLFPAVALLTVVPLAHLHLTRALWLFLVFPLLVIGAGALLLGLATWRRDPTMAVLSRLVRAVLPTHLAQRVEPFLVGFLDTLLGLFRKPRVLLVGLLYTVVAVTLDALFCYLAFRAVGGALSPSVVLYGYTLYNLAYILPTPPAHLGTNELIGLAIFSGVFGVSRSTVGAMFLFSHPFTGLLMTVTALVSLRLIGLDLRSTLRLRAPDVDSARAA